MIEIQLDQSEIELVEAVADEMVERNGPAKSPVFTDVHQGDELIGSVTQGFAAEYAVAKYVNKPWNWAYTGPNGCDIGTNIEVRSTTPGRGLYIKNREVQSGQWQKRPTTVYVLVYPTNVATRFQLIGFIQLDYALSNAMAHRKNGKTFGWIVAPDHLWPIERLRKALTT